MSFAASSRKRDARTSRFGILVLVSVALFVTLMGRLFYLQILRGDVFRESAIRSFMGHERIPARRGRILDASGKELASNQPKFEAVVTPHKLYRKGRDGDDTLRRLGVLLELTDDELAEVKADVEEARAEKKTWDPITLPRELTGDLCPYDGERLELMAEPEQHLFCTSCGISDTPVTEEIARCPRDKRKLVWEDGSVSQARHATCSKCGRRYVTTPICPNDGHLMRGVVHNLQCPVCGRTFTNQAAELRARRHDFPGVKLKTSFRRIYPFRYDAAHTLGYMNRVKAEEREEEPGVYGLTDMVGRRGLEWSLEPHLRGKAGRATYFKGDGGRVESEDGPEYARGIPALNGYDIQLTLDIRMQQAVRQAFRYYKSGAAVVVDPRDGRVMAIYSKPGFDPNVWSGRLSKTVWDQTRENPYTPLINKAVTAYHPGSVYKIVTATAALEAGIVTPDTPIYCPGHYDYGGRRFHCHNRNGHGSVTLVEAIKHSCDVYFYKVGEMMGMKLLATWGRRFGFGEATGIEAPERAGLVPTKKWHEEHSELGWQPGLTLSTAIGQGALSATTLQVARAFSAVVNGGSVLKLRLVDRYVNDKGETIKQFGPVEVGRLDADPNHLALIREGLVRVVNDSNGTAHNVKLDELVMAGKTGTAEAAEWRAGADDDLLRWLKEDHAWFAAYAPAEDPQVVVVVFVEHGGSGSKMAAPIAKKIVKSWMNLGFYEPPAAHPDDALLDEDEPALDEDVP